MYQVIEKNQQKYIECSPEASVQICNQNDALDWVAICGENDVHRLMVYGENFCEDFFHLRSGVAGEVLQKWVNYRIKVAAIIPPRKSQSGQI